MPPSYEASIDDLWPGLHSISFCPPRESLFLSVELGVNSAILNTLATHSVNLAFASDALTAVFQWFSHHYSSKMLQSKKLVKRERTNQKQQQQQQRCLYKYRTAVVLLYGAAV